MTNPTTKPDGRSLQSRLIRRGLVGQLVLAALVFTSAGKLKFWQGWAFLVVNFTATLGFCAYFYKPDPQLLEHRSVRQGAQTCERGHHPD